MPGKDARMAPMRIVFPAIIGGKFIVKIAKIGNERGNVIVRLLSIAITPIAIPTVTATKKIFLKTVLAI